MTLSEEMERLNKIQKEKGNVIEMPIEFSLTQNGNIKTNSLKNIGLILSHDPVLAKTFAYNEFTHEITVLKDIPALHIVMGDMSDDYTAAVLVYIEDRYEVLFAQKLFDLALTNEAHANSFNPVKDYMERAYKNWDHKSRVADFLPTFLGVVKSETTTLQTNLFFVGAVAKVYQPVFKFDYVFDLVGGQGAGKTTLLKKMANGWYTDQFTDFRDKDSYSNMLRALIVNDDEMTASNNSDFETLKKFISAEILEFRRSYGRHSERRPKSFVLARTTNEITYLKDKTGERRFMPNLVNKELQKLHPVTDLDQATVDQLWGEFVALYKGGFHFDLTPQQELMLDKNRESFMYIDAVEEEIEQCLATWEDDFIMSSDIAYQLGEKNLIGNRKLAAKIKYVMDNRKDWKIGSKFLKGRSRRGYRRK